MMRTRKKKNIVYSLLGQDCLRSNEGLLETYTYTCSKDGREYNEKRVRRVGVD